MFLFFNYSKLQPAKLQRIIELTAYFYEKLVFSLTFSLTNSIFVAVFLSILNSQFPIFTTSLSFGKL